MLAVGIMKGIETYIVVLSKYVGSSRYGDVQLLRREVVWLCIRLFFGSLTREKSQWIVDNVCS